MSAPFTKQKVKIPTNFRQKIATGNCCEITDEDVQRLDLKPTDEFETYQFIELPESPALFAKSSNWLPNIGFEFISRPTVKDMWLTLATSSTDPSAGRDCWQ